MRVCIVGGGLAGTLLAWRLAQLPGRRRIDLHVTGRTAATESSGGAVKAYETHPQQRELAIESLAELLSSPVLQGWSGYRRASFVSLRASADGLAEAVAGINARLPGGAELVAGDRLANWQLPGERTAVVERHAGYTDPGRWRDALLADCARRGVSIVDDPVGVLPVGHDVVVLATGAWTGYLLRANDLPAQEYRTKSIQYAVHPTGAWRPPSFSDEVTGLYARPTADGGLLLGLPAPTWDVDPDRPPLDQDLLARAAEQATALLPRLRLGPPVRQVGSADCYCTQPVLALRPVPGAAHVVTFTGGAGGSVKTALAASRAAATALAETGPRQATSVGRRKGQP